MSDRFLNLLSDADAILYLLRQEVVNEFHIPADADDTFVNIRLGGLLEKYKTF